jgi:hypothetical protein
VNRPGFVSFPPNTFFGGDPLGDAACKNPLGKRNG